MSSRVCTGLLVAMAASTSSTMLGCEQKSDAAPTENAEQPAVAATPASPLEAAARVEAKPKLDEQPRTAAMHPALSRYVAGLVAEIERIPEERKRQLEKLALFIRAKRGMNETAKLTFICTHNSRRSHLSQLWAQTAAAYYGIDGVATYSGGTEATAFNPRAVAAVRRAGFEVADPSEGPNPRYAVSFGPDSPPMQAFSKRYDAEGNPQQGFAAIMTCTQADKSCPVVEGSALRIALPYEDPKVADDTSEEAAKYDERTRQIALEMFYAFSRLRS